MRAQALRQPPAWFIFAIEQRTNVKTQKYILTALCLAVCVWSVTMIVGLVGLSRAQGWSALTNWLEVAAFFGAGFLPLILIWKAELGRNRTFLVATWALCLTYVGLLALNLMRLGFLGKAGIRLVVWAAIAVLFVRTLRLSQKSA